MNPNVLILDMVSAPAGSVLDTHLAMGFMDMQSRQVQLSLGGPHWSRQTLCYC